MYCPYCNSPENKVTESRTVEIDNAIRRRRECEECQRRFTTYEKIKEIDLMVVKNDGRRESFNREKLENGIFKACEKRPVSVEKIASIVNEIELVLRESTAKEISSRDIGELIMQKLHQLDQVAYVRFASVYRKFKDISEFLEEIKKIV